MHRLYRWLAALVVGALLALTSPASGQVSERDGWVDASPARDTNGSSFWDILGDPTLEGLIAEALEGSHDLGAARARVDGAKASRTRSALELAPIVTASAGYTRRRFSSYAFPGAGFGALPDQNVWESGLSASWEVDAFGRVRGDVRARGDLARAAEEDVRDARVLVAAEAAGAYFELRGLQDRLAVARRNAENQRHTLDLTEARLGAGRGTDFDAARARAQLSITLAAIPSLEAEIAASEYRIGVILGRPVEELGVELPEGTLPELPEVVPLVRAEDVLRRRPDVLGAEQRLAASRALTASARADYLPRISLVAGAGYTAPAVDAFGRSGTFNYAVGPVLSWAAFDLGRVKARHDEARAQELEARARREQTVLRAEQELGSATQRYQAARERLERLEDAAASSERAARLARIRYEGGVADFLQVLDAERTMLVTQDQLAQARTAAAQAYVALFEARAGIWEG